MDSHNGHHHDHTGHSHHGHGHHHHAAGNIGVAFFLNTGFAVIELIGGFITNSVAIMSDALHDFGDSLSLGAAWYFQIRSKKERDENFTYGYKRLSLIGAFVNAIVLIVGSIFIINESIQRLFNPEPADPKGMLLLAVLGVVVNGMAMLRLKKGDSINERVVSLHFLEDVLGWVAVLVGSLIMMFADVPAVDPILSLLIAGFILFNIYRNLKPAFQIILQGAPEHIGEEEIKTLLTADDKIVSFHDFRLWSLDGQHHVLTMHIVTRDNMNLKEAEALKEKVKSRLKKLNISHATIEVEFEPEHCDHQISHQNKEIR